METMKNDQIVLTPYKEILKEVGQQLNIRKKDIFGRTLLIVWPSILLGGFFIYLKTYPALLDRLGTISFDNSIFPIALGVFIGLVFLRNAGKTPLLFLKLRNGYGFIPFLIRKIFQCVKVGESQVN